MGIVTLVVHLLFELFVGTRIATVIALCVAVAVYGVALVLLGGVTEKELSSMPKGPKYARKLIYSVPRLFLMLHDTDHE